MLLYDDMFTLAEKSLEETPSIILAVNALHGKPLHRQLFWSSLQIDTPFPRQCRR